MVELHPILQSDLQITKFLLKSVSMKVVIGIITFLAVGLVVILALRNDNRTLNGERFPDQSRDHVPNGSELINYNSNPPTSGPHYGETVPWGSHTTEKDDRNLIHNLEHGGIWISYNCAKSTSFKLIPQVYAHEGEEESATNSATPSASQLHPTEQDNASQAEDPKCQELVKQLEEVVKKTGRKKIVLGPRSKNESLIALASWNWLLKLQKFDENKISQFIQDRYDKAPEYIPD